MKENLLAAALALSCSCVMPSYSSAQQKPVDAQGHQWWHHAVVGFPTPKLGVLLTSLHSPLPPASGVISMEP
jgi:hypothetical protein